jgi:hypothetical protein
MRGAAVWRASLYFAVMLLLGACGHSLQLGADDDNGANAYPTHYRSDILSAMHAYLNDPTGIRDAAISEPALKTTGNRTRYMACLRFNAKKNASEYAGSKEVAAVFLAGRFDQFIENAKEICKDAAYAPFPELQKLPP